jgi:hypothetical protein
MAVQQLPLGVADNAAEDGAGAGSESPDCADLRRRRSEHGSGGEAGPGQMTAAFVERRVDGLHDEPRSGAPRTVDDARIEAVIVRTLESSPENATHWSSRGMAKANGLSVSTVQRIWRASGLQPHRDCQIFCVRGLCEG